jgi:hypothetical protein
LDLQLLPASPILGITFFCGENDKKKLNTLQAGVMPIFEPHLSMLPRMSALLGACALALQKKQSAGERQFSSVLVHHL